MPRASVCLNMIVKNEAPVIERCLSSVLPFIDRWVIVDTGSTDGTQARVRHCLQARPGELHERDWRNFGHNRTEALELARGTADYLFFIDADETLQLPPTIVPAMLAADGYYIACEYAGTTYLRAALVATRLPWQWSGVVHECLTCASPFQLDVLAGPTIIVAHDGARSRDPETYARDAALLEEAVQANPDSTRDVFYLAQSYRDARQPAKSLSMYRRRASMGGWDEEVWYSLHQAALLTEQLGATPAEVSAAYLAAFQRRPSRAEPLVQLARYHRLRGEHALALVYARHAVTLPRPSDLLFVDEAAYLWRALDELAIAAYYAGATDEGRAAIRRLLDENQFPEAERSRIARNSEHYS